jgi:hypothetical protein
MAGWTTAHYQARQLAPLLGEKAKEMPSRVWALFVAEREALFGDDARPLTWWWSAATSTAR